MFLRSNRLNIACQHFSWRAHCAYLCVSSLILVPWKVSLDLATKGAKLGTRKCRRGNFASKSVQMNSLMRLTTDGDEIHSEFAEVAVELTREPQAGAGTAHDPRDELRHVQG